MDKRAVLEQLPTEALRRIASKQRRKRKVLRVEIRTEDRVCFLCRF